MWIRVTTHQQDQQVWDEKKVKTSFSRRDYLVFEKILVEKIIVVLY